MGESTVNTRRYRIGCGKEEGTPPSSIGAIGPGTVTKAVRRWGEVGSRAVGKRWYWIEKRAGTKRGLRSISGAIGRAIVTRVVKRREGGKAASLEAARNKLFHNLRASRQTELAAEYPIHVVCAWIGNSALIAARHYLQVTEDYYKQAALSATECACQRETGKPAENRNVRGVKGMNLESIPVKPYDYAWRDSNISQKTRENKGISGERGTDSGTLPDADRLEALAAELGKLAPEDRARLAALLLGGQGEGKDA